MDIQARLYWRIIRQIMDEDSYFKDFKLADYNFIVANRRTLQPLVWKFPLTQATAQISLSLKDKTLILRDPEVIGKELYGYLNNKSAVPNGIDLVKPNNILEWINKL